VKIKKLMILSSFLTAMIFTFAPRASAQNPVRIQFAKGAASASVKGTTGNYGVAYVVRARSGQKIVVDLAPATKIGIKIETKGADGQMVLLREERGGHFEVGLEESGDYTIFIGSVSGKPVAFTLTVKITKLADI